MAGSRVEARLRQLTPDPSPLAVAFRDARDLWAVHDEGTCSCRVTDQQRTDRIQGAKCPHNARACHVMETPEYEEQRVRLRVMQQAAKELREARRNGG